MVFLAGRYRCVLQHNPSSWMHILSYSCFPSPFKPSLHTWTVFYCLYRFKPLQKVDGMSDSLCGSSQHCNSTPEQSVAAQSQHHQQYIGEGKTLLAATTTAATLESEEWFKFKITSISFCCYGTESPVCVCVCLWVNWLTPVYILADTAHTLPPFPSPDLGSQPLPERINMNDIKKLQTLYRDHCEVSIPYQSTILFFFFCFFLLDLPLPEERFNKYLYVKLHFEYEFSVNRTI